MTTLVLLGGNNAHNKSWVHEVNQELLPLYDTTHIHTYRHWNQEGGTMDLEYECNQLYNYLKSISGNIILFCKSLGCLLGLKAIVEKEVFIKQCVFVGFPLGYAENNNFPTEKYVKELTCPVLWIQKTNDPIGSYDRITKELGSLSPAFICQEIPGDDHKYKDIALLKKIILDNNAR